MCSYGKQKHIGWGGGGNNSGMKGTSPGGPIKKIRRHAKKMGYGITIINEYNTSKSSLCCHGHRNKCMKDGHGETQKTVHGVSICTKCGKTWNRDVVGSSNILQILICLANGHDRPTRFNKNGLVH